MRFSTTLSTGIAMLPAITGVFANLDARQANDPQKSLTLNPKVIATGFANDGQDVPAAGMTFISCTGRYKLNFFQRPSLSLTSNTKEAPSAAKPVTTELPAELDFFQIRSKYSSKGETETKILLQNRDLVAISPTGTGKTLAYLLPIFARLGVPATNSDSPGGVRAVVVVPTRELAHQIHNECLKLAQGRKWKIVLFSKATANALSQKAARDKVDIIISTPLRLVSSLQEGNLELTNVRHLVLDEADRMLDAEFMDQIQEIVGACSNSHIQKALFSATLPSGAEKMAMEMVNNPIRIVVGLKDTPLPLISQSLTYVADDHSKLPSLLSYFAQPYNPPVLIFTSTQTRATSLAEELVLNGISNTPRACQYIDGVAFGATLDRRKSVLGVNVTPTRINKRRLQLMWLALQVKVLGKTDKKKDRIKHDSKTGSTRVTAIEVVTLTSPSQVLSLLAIAQLRRSDE
ncbi:hypothetical protein HYPSUDRAFT_205736 [Hypholoma sublateritium FD-334 SS-4]|uniref:RNA helicase n=1 Tax=Hypholoma sublateritium (strain FD-334 SS-4) TaxID=945553 RepID=A0A0D2KTP5_HYPSF|nr:hypothetical protein HYPSUDRAFT_205736 [Hypholoma sublateritium FD-334 SS-4]